MSGEQGFSNVIVRKEMVSQGDANVESIFKICYSRYVFCMPNICFY